MAKTWASFEDRVRELAKYIWGQDCVPKHIGGVDIDGSIQLDSDLHVFIEMTERRALEKVREDVTKLRTAKAALLAETGAFARCFCVVNGSVTQGMIDAGAPHQIKVMSVATFNKIFFDFDDYRVARENAAFGSAVNPLTGKKDDSPYVHVNYVYDGTTREISIADIIQSLTEGKRFVLLGEYGTGKSRCLREMFKSMATHASDLQAYPMAIDLREEWGVKRGRELIRRHLEDLGADKLQVGAIRAFNSGHLVLLLDGFDELGSQAWSNDSDKLRLIRAKSLEGVKDLIANTAGGVLITGREHYFNNNAEMFSALGLNPQKTILIRCKNEFSETEMIEFFKRIQEDIEIPTWLPRRPLICQTIADLSADELDEMFGVGENEIEFWNHFIRVLCERDARIHASFDAATIETILILLARLTRVKSANVGPITLSDVQAAFEAVLGQMPVEDAAVMLQRLPALGRVKAESNDRQFIDMYILDGLRAKDVARILRSDEATQRGMVSSVFINPLGDLGQRVLAVDLEQKQKEALQYSRRCFLHMNHVLGCDLVASMLRLGHDKIDFEGMSIVDGNFIRFDMSGTLPIDLHISKSIFGTLVLPSSPPPRTSISDSLAERVYGVGAASGLPAWVTNFTADKFDSVESVSRIRMIGLEANHEILATIVRKTFFQKGSGRKEEALLRGLGRVGAPSLSDKIINLLMKEDVLERFKGHEGWVYTPNRAFAGRMKKMLYELKTSQDPIWMKVAAL